MPGADLHLHSVWSDGVWTPERVAKSARRAGLSTVALTDHDTLAGLEAMRAAGEANGLRVISGVEISTWRDADWHLLAYGVDPAAPELAGSLARARDARRGRAERMVARLAELGAPITMDSVERRAGIGAIGRPHVAQALVDAGWVGTTREAFDRWLHDGGPACVEKPRLAPEAAIAQVHAAGGVAVAAHPGLYGAPETLDPLVEAGLDGVEVRHPLHGRKSTLAYDAYATERGLLRTGGSDFHGPGGGLEPGSVTVPDEWVDELTAAIDVRRRAAAEVRAAGTPGQGGD